VRRADHQHRCASGTGFVVAVQSESRDAAYGYLITADHVVRNQFEIEVETGDPENVGQLNPRRQIDSLRTPLPGVDLAIAPFHPGADRHFALQLEHHVLPAQSIQEPRLGGLLYYVGVFEPLHRLIARSGTIAALNQTVPHSGGYSYPAHLADCRSYDGFSGSPCFAEVTVATTFRRDAPYPTGLPPGIELTSLAHFQLLCGMFTGHFTDEVSAEGVTSRFGVGRLLRSDEIRAALMTNEAIEERQVWDAQGMPQP
jgi:Trypsin-like peptidase domain